MPRDTMGEALSLRKQALDMAEAGKTKEEIAAVLNLPVSVVSIWANPSARFDKAGTNPRIKMLKEMRAMRAAGIPDREISKAFGYHHSTVNAILGPQKDRKPKAKRVTRGMRIKPEAWQRCQEIALDHGLRVKEGPQYGQGSVSFLLEKIASGELAVVKAKMLEF